MAKLFPNPLAELLAPLHRVEQALDRVHGVLAPIAELREMQRGIAELVDHVGAMRSDLARLADSLGSLQKSPAGKGAPVKAKAKS